MLSISDIKARQILNSRGVPAVEVDVITSDGFIARSSAPSGASTGTFESLDLYDGGKEYFGKSVHKAISNVLDIIKPALIGMDPTEQTLIDKTMMRLDGTQNDSHLGGNAILSVSLAVCKAGAHAKGVQPYRHIRDLYNPKDKTWKIPTPMFNIVNGGAHADNNIAMQEFMVVPKGIQKYDEQLRAGAEIYHTLKQLLKDRKLPTGVGDEGGFAPSLDSDQEAMKLIMEAVEKTGYKMGKQIFIGLDVAVSQYAKTENGKTTYNLHHQGKSGTLTFTTSTELIQYYDELVREFPIFSIEDGLAEEDWSGWQMLAPHLKAKNVYCVGDDFTVTNPKRFTKAVGQHGVNGIIIKPNQVGSLTEVIEVAKIADAANVLKIASHRSGETGGTIIAHIAVGIGAQMLKDGATARTERVAKYNELLRIEEELNQNS